MINEVVPSYERALKHFQHHKHMILVLPGRSLSTRSDREQLHALAAEAFRHSFYPQIIPRREGCVKYVDMLLTRI